MVASSPAKLMSAKIRAVSTSLQCRPRDSINDSITGRMAWFSFTGPPARNGATAALVSRNFLQRVGELDVKCRLLRRIEGDQCGVRRLRGGRIGGSSARSPFGDEVGRVFVFDTVDRVVDRRVDNGK